MSVCGFVPCHMALSVSACVCVTYSPCACPALLRTRALRRRLGEEEEEERARLTKESARKMEELRQAALQERAARQRKLRWHTVLKGHLNRGLPSRPLGSPRPSGGPA